MVVNDLNVMRVAGIPAKTDPPLLVDPNAPLTESIALQRFKMIARWDVEVSEIAGGVEHLKLRERTLLDSLRQSPGSTLLVDGQGFLAPEALDHAADSNNDRY